MSIGFLFFVRDSLSIVIAVAIASSSRILFSNPFMPLLMTTGSRLKCPAVALNGRLANSFPKYPTTALPNAPGRLRVLLYNKSLDMFNAILTESISYEHLFFIPDIKAITAPGILVGLLDQSPSHWIQVNVS